MYLQPGTLRGEAKTLGRTVDAKYADHLLSLVCQILANPLFVQARLANRVAFTLIPFQLDDD